MSNPPSVFGGFSMALEQVIYNKVSTQSILVFMPMVKKDMNKGGRTKAVEQRRSRLIFIISVVLRSVKLQHYNDIKDFFS